jgi:hypothetical protein
MATRQRGSNGRAPSSKQPGLGTVPAPGMQAPADHVPTGKDGSREQRIAVSAYLRAAQRGFAPGHELEDWLAAERELEANGEIGLTTQRQ